MANEIVQLSTLGAPIKVAYESQANTNAFTDAEKSKLASIPTSYDKTTVGLNNVDNTSDVNKPVSTAVQTALNLKANVSSIPATLDQLSDGSANRVYTTSEKTKLSLIAAGATVNDTDSNLKNRANHTGTQLIATVTGLQAALDLKSTIDSPALTGTPSVPTPAESSNTTVIANTAFVRNAVDKKAEALTVALSDEITPLVAGNGKVTFRMPYGLTLTGIKGSLNTAATGTTLVTVDVRKNGTSILSTKLTFDAGTKTTIAASVAAIISDISLPADSEVSFDIISVGSSTAGVGLKITLLGHQG